MARRSVGKREHSLAGLWLLAVVVACAVTMVGLGIVHKPSGLMDKLDASCVVIDLPSGRYAVAPSVARPDESFPSLVRRLKPYAAITGTYYDPGHRPLGDILVAGKLVSHGHQRQGIGFTKSGGIKFVERKPGSRIDWRGCESGIACGPRLIRAGKLDINVRRDGFRMAAASHEASRCAVGAAKDGKLILCVVREPITIDVLARLMLELGARDAINLDGGSMCALYESGSYYASPSNPMSSVLAIYKRP